MFDVAFSHKGMIYIYQVTKKTDLTVDLIIMMGLIKVCPIRHEIKYIHNYYVVNIILVYVAIIIIHTHVRTSTV